MTGTNTLVIRPTLEEMAKIPYTRVAEVHYVT